MVERSFSLFYTSFCLFAFISSVYISTLYPSIPGGDSGELVAESCHLGISHPPGYPFFNLLYHLFISYIHINDRTIAWHANLLTALLDAMACVLMYLSILEFGNKTLQMHLSGLAASVTFAFSPLTWTYAVGAEVFALNNFFVACLIYLSLRFAKTGLWKMLYIGAFCSGLSMTNQHTIILLQLPIIIWICCLKYKSLTLKRIGYLALCYLLGLLPYAYMPIASNWNPQPGSWGDVTSLSGFIHHIRRADYGTFKLYSTTKRTESLIERLSFYIEDLSTNEGFIIVPIIAGLGMFFSLLSIVLRVKNDASSKVRKPKADYSSSVGSFEFLSFYETFYHPSVVVLLLFAYIFYIFIFHWLSNLPLNEGLLFGIHMRFWQQPNIIVFIFYGLGLNILCSFLHFIKTENVFYVAILACLFFSIE